MYKILFGFTFTVCSVEDAIDETMLTIKNTKIITNNNAEPRNEARNVLKNDFIITILNQISD